MSSHIWQVKASEYCSSDNRIVMQTNWRARSPPILSVSTWFDVGTVSTLRLGKMSKGCLENSVSFGLAHTVSMPMVLQLLVEDQCHESGDMMAMSKAVIVDISVLCSFAPCFGGRSDSNFLGRCLRTHARSDRASFCSESQSFVRSLHAGVAFLSFQILTPKI